ncbi:HNH endonuclease [Kribbella voronezhensis]|uniref:HNH endonuclease n=1 Tax=Kribbella voronezhensis TaxID=2512212 RepID=A0A4R7SSZ3_9ACTN|nr:HNH endonuclease signature motif containing protein [Kribbella voronezhensis]TDU82382.1 HNH endonuclease [Kribbella voronezhensis]
MEVQVLQRPCMMSGEQAVATLDALHAEIARLQTYSLEVIARLDDTGHTKTSTGQDTARFLSTRYRRNLYAVRHDLALANALPKYPAVTAALPNPYAPPGPNPTVQYTAPDAPTKPTDTTATAERLAPDAAAERTNATAAAERLGPDASGEHSNTAAAEQTNATVPAEYLGLGAATEQTDATAAAERLGLDAAGDLINTDAAAEQIASDAAAGCTDSVAAGDGEGGDEGGGGRVLLPVLLHPEQAEAIVSGLEAIPTAAMVPVEDLRVAEEQLVEAARHLAPADLKRLARQARDVLDTDGPEPAEQAAARREALRLVNADHGVKFSGFLANDNAELFRSLIEAAAKPHKTPDGKPDPRPRDKRHADALTQVLTSAAAAGDLPAHGGVKPHITVTIDYTDLKTAGRDATGDLQFGDSLSAAAVRRLACDAGVLPVVLGSASEPLDVGREQRYVTKAIRQALNRRDKGCVVCGAPPRYCHAHHIVHWIDGGATSLENLALFCGTDHIAVHAGIYTVTIINGTAHVTRPTWANPPRNPPSIPGITRHFNPAASHTATTADATTTTSTTTKSPQPTGTDQQPGAETNAPQLTGIDGAPTDEATAPQLTGIDGAPTDEATAPKLTGTDGAPWPGTPSRTLRPARAFPLFGDPPPLTTSRPPDFDPWAPETLDTG